MGKRHEHFTEYTESKQTHERCLTSLAIREMWLKSTMRYHYTLHRSHYNILESLQKGNSDNIKAGEDAEKVNHSCITGRNV